MAEFAKVIFKDTEDVWDEQFRVMGKVYKQPTLVLFSDQVESACGMQSAAVGPVYCPNDGKVYIDLSFFNTLEKQLGAAPRRVRPRLRSRARSGTPRPATFGILRPRRRGSPDDEPDRVQQDAVRLELQADFLAEVSAIYAQRKHKFLQKGDLESATNAAFRIGDDVLQKQARGRVSPDGFTHGTAKQRQRWFLEGFNTGDVKKARELFDLPYEKL